MIKIRSGYYLRNVLDSYVVMSRTKETYTPGVLMSTNESGALLWKLLENGAEEAELIGCLTEEYGITEEDARRDVTRFLGKLRERALIEE